MCNYLRLSNTYELALDIEKRKLGGAFVECGTWRGGCGAIMSETTNRFGSNRTTWFFDSFEGMPEPTDKDVADTKTGKKKAKEHVLTEEGYAKASISDVEEVVFKKLKLSKEKNIIIKGWFKNTLPEYKEKIGKIAILRLDGDWYESTMTTLEELYDKVVDGGYVIIDDYGGWEGCRKAVHEYLDNKGVVPNFKFIGTYDPLTFKKIPPVYFKKGEKCENIELYFNLGNYQ